MNATTLKAELDSYGELGPIHVVDDTTLLLPGSTEGNVAPIVALRIVRRLEGLAIVGQEIKGWAIYLNDPDPPMTITASTAEELYYWIMEL